MYQRIITNPKFIISTLIVAAVYVVSVVYLMNARLVADTIFGQFPISYKFTLLIALLGGMWTAMTGLGLFTLVITATLTGINLTLITQRISTLKKSKNLHFAVGGSSFLGIMGSGCAACGLPVISFLGLTGSLVYLPFRGVELSYMAIILLTASIYFMIKRPATNAACQLESSLTPSGSFLRKY